MLDTIFLQIFDMTKVASIVILVVLLVRLCLKRAPKVFSYALWAVVLFRLLCPVSIEAPISLIPQTEPTIQSYDLLNESITPIAAVDAAQQSVGDVLNGGIGIQHVKTTEFEEDGTRRIISTDWWNVWMLFIKHVWLFGMAALLVYSTISLICLKRRLICSVCLQDNIYLADHIDSPFVMGLIRPKIYLPSSLSEKERDYIILHEQHHIRRGDHVVKLLSFAALCLHCFNPLVWIAFILSGKDMEMSCDEAVLRKLGEEIRVDYSASLISLATGRRIIAGAPLAFGEGNTEGRIKNIAKWKKPTVWGIVIAVIVCVAVVLFLGTDAMTTPYSWTSNITAADIADSSVTAYGDHLYQAELTEDQKEQLAQCLRNMPKSSMRRGQRDKTTQKSLLVSIILPHEDGKKKIPLFYDGNSVMQLSVRTSYLRITSTWIFEDPALLSFFEEFEEAVLNGQGTLIESITKDNSYDGMHSEADILAFCEVMDSMTVYNYLEENLPKAYSEYRTVCAFEVVGFSPTDLYLYVHMAEYDGNRVGNNRTYYPMVLHGSFDYGIIEIKRHSLPEDGVGYGSSMRKLFPEAVRNRIAEKEAAGEYQYLEQAADERYAELTKKTQMVPTTANITGAFDGYLYVPIDGANYRYERIFDDPSSVTCGKLMYTFTEEADPDDVEWRVYAVDDYPDRSVLLAEAGDDYVHLYRYSPSKAVDPAMLGQAKDKGKIVVEDGNVSTGADRWDRFYSSTQDGESYFVEIAHYLTLENGNYDAKYYEVYKEDYPYMTEFDLAYDGTKYILHWREQGTPYVREYKYLRMFEDTLPTTQSSKEPQKVTRYVLTNNNTASWEELVNSLASSRLEDHIDYFPIYSVKN